MQILETARVVLREIVPSDADFILELLNEPSFHKYIGDKGVSDTTSARDYIENNFRKSYKINNFGLWLVETKDLKAPIGICGFVKRETLDFPDIGFAFLTRYEKQGYGLESAKAVIEYGRTDLKMSKILAITTPDNAASGRLLEKIGLTFESNIESPSGEHLKLYSITL